MSNSEAAESSAGDSSKVNLSVEERMERKGIPKAPVLVSSVISFLQQLILEKIKFK